MRTTAVTAQWRYHEDSPESEYIVNYHSNCHNEGITKIAWNVNTMPTTKLNTIENKD